MPNSQIEQLRYVLFERKLAWLHKPLRFFYDRLIKGNVRRNLVKLRGYTPWISKEEFRINIGNIIESIYSNTNSQIIILGINKGSKRIEKALPGTLENYRVYDKILEEISAVKNCDFVKVSNLESNLYFPDGIHYNEKGHLLIAKMIEKHL